MFTVGECGEGMIFGSLGIRGERGVCCWSACEVNLFMIFELMAGMKCESVSPLERG